VQLVLVLIQAGDAAQVDHPAERTPVAAHAMSESPTHDDGYMTRRSSDRNVLG
jgi:hypothetical protein